MYELGRRREKKNENPGVSQPGFLRAADRWLAEEMGIEERWGGGLERWRKQRRKGEEREKRDAKERRRTGKSRE